MFVERLLHSYNRLDRWPGYMPAHRATGLRGSDGAREWDEPEAVHGQGRHAVKRGRCETIREVPEAYAADLKAIDAERAALKKRLAELRRDEAAVLELAYQAGKPVTVAAIIKAKANKGAE